jgi:aspartyl-tRNA(Asn)/glutamyl-tRNA(Gln) amidotransferase subunit A
MSNLHTKTIHELCDGLTQGDFSSEELVKDMLAAVERVEPEVKAYLWMNPEDALAQAQAADAARAAGAGNALLGIPLSIKALINVKGQPCTCGAQILQGYEALYDATVVARLREAGAVFLGRTNMDEFAMGSSTENSSYHVTRNPWNVDYVPGGSSGGAAASVAAGTALGSIATDTGGSIRQPAAFCGCVGLKPSYGRVSRYGLTAYASSLDQAGAVTRDVEDAALILEVIAGRDEHDATSVDQPIPRYRDALGQDLKDVKLGLPKEYFVEGIDPEVEQAVRRAADVCVEQGAELVEVSLPHTRYAVATYYIIATAEASANLARFDGVRYGRRESGADPIEMYGRTRAAGFGSEVKRRIILGTYVLSSGYYDAYYVRAQQVRALIRRDFDAAFKECDAILAPVAPTPAYRIGSCTNDPLQMYLGDIFTVTANLAGICGLAVPCGLSGDGLPIGVQVLGAPFEEQGLLRVGHALEQAQEPLPHPSVSAF